MNFREYVYIYILQNAWFYWKLANIKKKHVGLSVGSTHVKGFGVVFHGERIVQTPDFSHFLSSTVWVVWHSSQKKKAGPAPVVIFKYLSSQNPKFCWSNLFLGEVNSFFWQVRLGGTWRYARILTFTRWESNSSLWKMAHWGPWTSMIYQKMLENPIRKLFRFPFYPNKSIPKTRFFLGVQSRWKLFPSSSFLDPEAAHLDLRRCANRPGGAKEETLQRYHAVNWGYIYIYTLWIQVPS